MLYWASHRAVRRAGGRPVRLRPGDLFSGLEGYVFGGGSDIDPRRYRLERSATSGRLDLVRDHYELRVARDARQRGCPILGICRGAQLLNVSAGGTLHPDLRVDRPRRASRRFVFARKRVEIREGSRLRAVLCRRTIRVNAFHHQSVHTLGTGLRVVAEDRYGIVQAIESVGPRFELGVQWHPELLPRRADSQRLFAALVEAARAR